MKAGPTGRFRWRRLGRPPYAGTLTPRQQDVFDLLVTGLTNEEIAERLGITSYGVKYHVAAILQRLGVENRYEAASLRLRSEGSARFAGWAPLLFLRKAPFPWLGKAVAAGALTAAAAGIALLAWGVLATGLRANGAVTAISASTNRTCALKDGGVWCWGANEESGQLGNSSTTDSSVPVAVLGLANGVDAIRTGDWGSCALKDGGVWCWGFEPGSADSAPPGCPREGPCSLPVLMSDVASGVSAISVGANFGELGNSNPFTCAVKEGAVWCLDPNPDNTACQTGACNYIFMSKPGLETGVSAISMGDRLGCAIKDGIAWCWGSNWTGQLGNHATTDSPVPVPVSTLGGGVSAISAGGAHVCALKHGGVWCWGINRDGQLGNDRPTYDPGPAPVAVVGLESGVSTISAGGAHTCALKDGGVWCWGRNAAGQLGDNSTADSAVPVAVAGLRSDVSVISAGGSHTCAVQGESVLCWGRNDRGQLGNARPPGSDVAVAVSGLASGVTAIEGTCALKQGGVWCWGPNGNGQVGNNTTTDAAAPVAVSGLTSGVSAISVGLDLRCAIKDGGAWCWGNNWAGQLGNGSTSDSPVPVAVSGLTSGVTAIRVGNDRVCAIKDGGAWCWGSNNGQFGDASTQASPVPVPLPGSRIPPVGSNAFGTCDLQDGGAFCWVYPGGVLTRMVVAGLETGVSAVAGNCALKDGGVWCLDPNPDFVSLSPAQPVPGFESGVSAISSSCVLKDGGVWCGLGLGGATAMPGLASGVTAITDTCALKGGGVWCWGSNSHGQLGNNSPADSLVPVPVQFPATTPGDNEAGSEVQPLAAQRSGGSSDHRTAYVLGGTAAGVLAIVVAGTWVMWRRDRVS